MYTLVWTGVPQFGRKKKTRFPHIGFTSGFLELKAYTLQVIIRQEYAQLKQRKMKKNEEENEDDEEENDLGC